MEALAAVSHAEDRRHSPWMDPADGLDRLERGLYAYNMKRLFKEGLKLQRSLAAAPAPRLSPHAAAVPKGGVSNNVDREGVWATLVGRRIDQKRCRVVGAGPMAARALGTDRSGGGDRGGHINGGGGAGDVSLPSIDALVHSVFVSQPADEDEDDAAVPGAASSARQSHGHVAAPGEMCRGAGADNTVVYRLTRRHVELAVSRWG